MTAMSAFPYARQKKSNGYGRRGASQISSSAFSKFVDDNSEDEVVGAQSQPAPPKAKSAPAKSDNHNVASQHAGRDGVLAKVPARNKDKRAKTRDMFEVPSSDDNEDTTPARTVPRPVMPGKALIDDRRTQLAPWEQVSSPAREQIQSGSKRGTKATKGQDTPGDNQQASKLRFSARGTSNLDRQIGFRPNPSSPTKDVGLAGMGAAARLAARRKVDENSAPIRQDATVKDSCLSPKRAAVGSGAESEGEPRKRARTATLSREPSVDLTTTDAAWAHDMLQQSAAEADVYNFSDSSADESAKSRQPVRSQQTCAKRGRRGRLVPEMSRTTPKKGISAPARLSEMLAGPSDTDTTEISANTPPTLDSRDNTPHQPSTPGFKGSKSPATAIKGGNGRTPKQTQLWNKLLPADPIGKSPSSLGLKDLTLDSKSEEAESIVKCPPKSSSKSRPETARRRTRLVDRLRASAPQSLDDGTSSSDDGDWNQDDEVNIESPVVEDNGAPGVPLPRSQTSNATSAIPSRAPQSQIPAVPATLAGSKRTYARQRSHLQDDSIEDGLMAPLIPDPPQPTSRTGATHGSTLSASQKLVFEFDESDDDAVDSAKIRTIHELRASGRSIRGMEDIEQLLEDVENHSPSHRGRRRSAFIELGTKLADKDFVSRFLAQSCEVRLARQCSEPRQLVVDFVLAASVALILAREPPQLTVQSLHDLGLVSWLAGLLQEDVQITKLAKDRATNMSRASQSSLADFADLLRDKSPLWQEEKPVTMTPRLMALKSLELLVTRLRRSGNKDELLGAQQLASVLPDVASALTQGNVVEVATATSILESLSATSLPLTWNASIHAQLTHLVPNLDTTSPFGRHTLFLALRLCLNLTTDHACNSALLSTHNVIDFLLQSATSAFSSLPSMTPILSDTEPDPLTLDLLVLTLGTTINLFENSADARAHACSAHLPPLIAIFAAGQRRLTLAESVAESVSNVAFGYLAVALANLCQDPNARGVVRGALSGSLDLLVEAVEEFVRVYQRVEAEGQAGEEELGFTARLVGVLKRLREVRHE